MSINRNTAVFAGEITLEYATSDLTAIGVDAIKYEECLSLPTGQRSPSGCNHYQQTSGLVTIAAGSSSGGFTVNIMNDLCRQPFFRFIQVTLSVPGSGALQGQKIQAQIRIDDDDFLQDLC